MAARSCSLVSVGESGLVVLGLVALSLLADRVREEGIVFGDNL